MDQAEVGTRVGVWTGVRVRVGGSAEVEDQTRVGEPRA